ncbi:MAG: cytochrome b5 domain-containing protein [Turneriella sp.]
MVRFFLLTTLFALPLAARTTYTAAQVASHKTAASCWLIIDDAVYDVTKYLKRHEDFDYDITRHCGSDATKLWHKKPQTGEEHSRKAERLLDRYRIGTLGK